MKEECKKCPHRKHNICGCQCGKYAANCTHPLSPCERWQCDDKADEPVCVTNEEYAAEGNRCKSYCVWLQAMHEERQRVKDAAK